MIPFYLAYVLTFFVAVILAAMDDAGVAHDVALTPEFWTTFVGFIVPVVIARIRTPTTTATEATIMLAVASFVLGAGGAIVTGQIDFAGQWDVNRIFSSGATCFTAATLFYNLKFRDTMLNAKLIGAGFTNPASGLIGAAPATAADLERAEAGKSAGSVAVDDDLERQLYEELRTLTTNLADTIEHAIERLRSLGRQGPPA